MSIFSLISGERTADGARTVDELVISAGDQNLEAESSMLTVRMWDSGVRLLPEHQALYLGQLSEEQLVQRFGLFSYWRSVPGSDSDMGWVREALGALDQKIEQGNLLLLRERP